MNGSSFSGMSEWLERAIYFEEGVNWCSEGVEVVSKFIKSKSSQLSSNSFSSFFFSFFFCSTSRKTFFLRELIVSKDPMIFLTKFSFWSTFLLFGSVSSSFSSLASIIESLFPFLLDSFYEGVTLDALI